MSEPVTICFACRHHWSTTADIYDPGDTYDQGDDWYNQRCRHSAVRLKKELDPVTGKPSYGLNNTLGAVNPDDQAHPYCKDINDGHCKHFEDKPV